LQKFRNDASNPELIVGEDFFHAKGKSMKAFIGSIALIAASVVSANAQTPSPGSNMSGSGQFCLKTSSGNTNCIYQTMGACEMAKAANSSDQCIEQAKPMGTTGSGNTTTPPANANPPGIQPR
jgi:hypothetical protein